MEDYVFNECHRINNLLLDNKQDESRNILIKLLDYHKQNKIQYSPLVNHLIRELGLFPYIDYDTSQWQERLIYDVFSVDVGDLEEKTLHREQSLLLKKLLNNENIAVSAPTSFGKSFVIDAFIKLKKPKNVVILVPTLALTDETRRRLYKKFAKEYKIITTTDAELANKNIFVFPQERSANYVNKLDEIDILIVDEFYKASINFDKDRAPALIKAIIELGKIAKQKYFLAPNITSLSHNPFTQDMEFIKIDFNTVFLQKTNWFKNIKTQEEKASILLKILKEKSTKTLIYAGVFKQIDELSTILLDQKVNLESQKLISFSKWLEKNYSYNWILPKLIKKGVGIHNGRLHRSLSQIQVKLFEEQDGICEILSTSSIIEGVNTSAENVVIWKNKNGRSNLNDFTYRNIIGRGGRMFKHFIGNIHILDSPPKREETQLELPFPDDVATSLDSSKYEEILDEGQISKMKTQENEMEKIFENQNYIKLKEENILQTTKFSLIKEIATSLKYDKSWNGLGYLNGKDRTKWDRILKKIIRLQPGNWETSDINFVEFIKIISYNWHKSIPEQLRTLEKYNIGIDEFFQLEKNVTYKFTALLRDLNTLQKEIMPEKNYDISKFINWCSSAFLPQIVYQLEEYGLPRMISIKIHKKGIINLINSDIYKSIDTFNEIGLEGLSHLIQFDSFENYILDNFYDGITTLKD